eukprot:6879766-Prymnesium_polylepis.2
MDRSGLIVPPSPLFLFCFSAAFVRRLALCFPAALRPCAQMPRICVVPLRISPPVSSWLRQMLVRVEGGTSGFHFCVLEQSVAARDPPDDCPLPKGEMLCANV